MEDAQVSKLAAEYRSAHATFRSARRVVVVPLLIAALSAIAAASPAAYDLKDLPEVAEVLHKVNGRDALDTAARQMSAFFHLAAVVRALSEGGEFGDRMSTDEQALVQRYTAAANAAQRRGFDQRPSDWNAVHARYDVEAHRLQLLDLLAPRIKSAYMARRAALQYAVDERTAQDGIPPVPPGDLNDVSDETVAHCGGIKGCHESWLQAMERVCGVPSSYRGYRNKCTDAQHALWSDKQDAGLAKLRESRTAAPAPAPASQTSDPCKDHQAWKHLGPAERAACDQRNAEALKRQVAAVTRSVSRKSPPWRSNSSASGRGQSPTRAPTRRRACFSTCHSAFRRANYCVAIPA